MEEHSQIKSRQCKGMSDPEGAQPKAAVEHSASVGATFAGEVKRGTKFDDNGPDCCTHFHIRSTGYTRGRRGPC